jgi:glucose/arabinose dehydrogenase
MPWKITRPLVKSVCFVTGFVKDDGNMWGRPAGVAAAGDGSLVFTGDASNSIWRVSYVGNKRATV